MRYLGLDLGSRTLGVAISTSGILASLYTVIRHNEEYDRLVEEVKNIVELKPKFMENKERISEVVVLGVGVLSFINDLRGLVQ